MTRVPANALDPDERAAVLEALDSVEFIDKSPAQAWAVLLDRGCYLGSVSTFYRVLREAGPVRERRAVARHPPGPPGTARLRP